MQKKLQKKCLRIRKGNKGFTLVEVIVVLVILAILATILVPRLTGWIDESKGKSAVGEAHLVLSALQASATELYALGTIPTGDKVADQPGKYFMTPNDCGKIAEKSQLYLEGDAVIQYGGYQSQDRTLSLGPYTAMKPWYVSPDAGIEKFRYRASNGKIVDYDNGIFTIVESIAYPSER